MMRSGIGYDVHQFATGRRLILGGVEINHELGLAGHSDADVLLHAIMDALLGAVARGDIGVHFPPSEEAWRDVSSRDLLRRTMKIIGPGWTISNIDATVIAEYPKLMPYRDVICGEIATLTGIDLSQVNLKATTNEQLGFVGRGEGIAAMAIATVYPSSSDTEDLSS